MYTVAQSNPKKKRPDLWQNNSCLLRHDKALANILSLVREFLPKNKTVTMPQPPYSPDIWLRIAFFYFQK